MTTTGGEVNGLQNNKLIELMQFFDGNQELDDLQVNKIEKKLDEYDQADPLGYGSDDEAPPMGFSAERMAILRERESVLERQREELLHEIKIKKQKKKRLYQAVKYASSFAASFAVIMFVLNSPVIADLKFIEPLKKWTATVLRQEIENPIQDPIIISDGIKQYSSYKNIERDYNIKIMTFDYTPEGYNLDKINVYEDDEDNLFLCQSSYLNGDNIIFYSIEYIKNRAQWTEKIDYDIEEIRYGKNVYYLYENMYWLHITWSDGDLFYTLYGEITKDEAMYIIHSIK